QTSVPGEAAALGPVVLTQLGGRVVEQVLPQVEPSRLLGRVAQERVAVDGEAAPLPRHAPAAAGGAASVQVGEHAAVDAQGCAFLEDDVDDPAGPLGVE